MGLSFATRKYVCNSCGHKGTVYSAIKNINDISVYFTEDSRPSEISNTKLYFEVLERDSFGLISKREVVESSCEICGSSNYTPETVQIFNNVLNFYPPCEAGKWYNGFSK